MRLTTNFVSDENPSWSPDGARIAFERGNGTNAGDPTKELWAMDADGTDAVALTTNSVYDADRRGRRTARSWRSRAGQTATRRSSRCPSPAGPR